ncbi:MAG: hypothetical protein ABI960_00935 [Candidatus Eisenbacteria bacterium]
MRPASCVLAGLTVLLLALAVRPALADLTIHAVHVRDGGMTPDLRLTQDERIELTATRRRTDDSTSYQYTGKDRPPPPIPRASAMTEVVALDQGVLWGWAPDGDGYREAPLSQVRSQRGALWRQVLAPEPDPSAAIEQGADSLGPWATPAWKFASGKRTIAGLPARRVVSTWHEGGEDSIVFEAWIAREAPGAAESAAFDSGARAAMLLDPVLPLGVADQWGPAWLRVARVLRAAEGMPLALKVSRLRSSVTEAGPDGQPLTRLLEHPMVAIEDRFEVLAISTESIDPLRFQLPARLRLLE